MKRRTMGLAMAAFGLAGCVAGQPAAVNPSVNQPAVPSASPSATPTSGAYRVGGKVYDDDLNPLAGVTVTAGSVDVQTGADGTYVMSLPVGSHTLTASKPGWTQRAQAVTVAGDATVNFGGIEGAYDNPYFLSNNPEISRMQVTEDAFGGPLTLNATFSVPLPEASRQRFVDRLEIRAGDRDFLRGGDDSEPALRLKSSWDAEGRVLTLRYDEPYLASGETTAQYAVSLRQTRLDTKDPVTDEFEWTELGVTDAEGHPLGKGRADFMFLKPMLAPNPLSMLSNKDWGYTPAIRRWNLTHEGPFRFVAARDEKGPGVAGLKISTEQQIGGSVYDVLEVRFTEPMRVVKDADNLQFTRLDADKRLLIINMSKDASGAGAVPLGEGYKVQKVRFSRTEPNLVYFQYPSGAFKDMNWLEVTLDDTVLDPAGNKPDPDKRKLASKV